MKPLVLLFLLLSTLPAMAVENWKCAAELDSKDLPMKAVNLGYQLDYPDSQHNYGLLFSSENFQFIYINSSKNKKNFLRYTITCPEKKVSCIGNFDSSYNEVKTQRPLIIAVSSRSTQLMDKNKAIIEYSKSSDNIELKFSDSEITFRCTK